VEFLCVYRITRVGLCDSWTTNILIYIIIDVAKDRFYFVYIHFWNRKLMILSSEEKKVVRHKATNNMMIVLLYSANKKINNSEMEIAACIIDSS